MDHILWDILMKRYKPQLRVGYYLHLLIKLHNHWNLLNERGNERNKLTFAHTGKRFQGEKIQI